VSPHRQARRLARALRAYEANLVRMFYPALTGEQVRLVVRHAEQVRLKDGTLLSTALGR
jgi:hypothetical protein